MAQEEGRRARKRYKNAPSYDEVKAKIDAKEKAAAERKAERAAARKPLTPAERYEQEKAARKDKSGGFSQHRMTGSRGHGSEYQNTRSIREEVLSYLLDEGFASDEKSAEAIMGAMSEAWVESIVEQASTVASSGGAGGKVTADKQYPATLRGLKGVKSTDKNGTDIFNRIRARVERNQVVNHGSQLQCQTQTEHNISNCILENMKISLPGNLQRIPNHILVAQEFPKFVVLHPHMASIKTTF